MAAGADAGECADWPAIEDHGWGLRLGGVVNADVIFKTGGGESAAIGGKGDFSRALSISALRRLFSGGNVPEDQMAVIIGREEQCAIRAELHRADRRVVLQRDSEERF